MHFFDGYNEWREQAACEVSVVLADDLKALIPMGNAIDNMCKVRRNGIQGFERFIAEIASKEAETIAVLEKCQDCIQGNRDAGYAQEVSRLHLRKQRRRLYSSIIAIALKEAETIAVLSRV